MWNSITGALRQHVLPRLTLYHFAALLLLSASALANFRYGLEFGHSDLEKAIAASASLGADLFNALGLLLVAWAFSTKRWAQATAGIFALICTFTYSINAGLGFAASTKDALIAERSHTAGAEKDRAGDKKRLQAQLDGLAPARSKAEIQPQIDLILADRRAGGCKKLDGRYTKQYCPKYFDLLAELGRWQTRQDLKSQLAAITTNEQTNKPFVEDEDPLASAIVAYLAKIGIQLKPENIRPWQTLLFVVLVVGCGPVALWLAEEYVTVCRRPLQPQKPAPVDRPRPESPPPPAVKQDVDSESRVSKPSIRQKLPPAANTTLHKLKASGGRIEAPSQNRMAASLKMSRTSLRRAVDALQQGGFIKVDDANGYYAMCMA